MTPDFKVQMRRMLGLRFPPADMGTHWEALQRIHGEVLEAAVTRAIASQSDFPTPHELLTYADLVRPATALQEDDPDRRVPLEAPVVVPVPHTDLVLTVRDTWAYDCESCSDGGMVSVWCGQSEPSKPWYVRGVCGRRNAHPDHEYVRECVCVATNPTIQRRLAARRERFAAEPVKQRRAS